ncbi:MAG: hypothetical protein KGH58_01245 [Candidatus Micrarchaeota archaeon]|nr:hypothetical protein [Candidatus Micrarchaeota archaeon]
MSQRAQATIEFMVLLGATASLAVVGLAMYHHLTASQATVFSALDNASAPAHQPQQQVPEQYSITVSLGGTSYLNRSNSLYLLITAPYGAYISGANITSTGGIVAPSAMAPAITDGITLARFSFIPSTSGPGSVSASVEITYNGTSTELNGTAYTYSVPFIGPAPGGGSSPQFSASISSANQSVVYPVGQPVGIGYATEWSHCSYHSWSGSLLPFGAQCGDANWDFNVWSDSCYWTHGVVGATYCVKLNSTPSSYATISGQQSYLYDMELRLYNQTLSLAAAANSLNSTSELRDAYGRPTGIMEITEVSGIGPDPSQGYVVLNASGARRAVAFSGYQSFEQALNNLDSVMGYYNQTGIQDSDLSAIQSAIQGYDGQALQFTNSSNVVNPQCSLSSVGGNFEYLCSPVSGLYYTINASVDGVNITQSISVGGSTVRIS